MKFLKSFFTFPSYYRKQEQINTLIVEYFEHPHQNGYTIRTTMLEERITDLLGITKAPTTREEFPV